MHSFTRPRALRSAERDDAYGGSASNRARLLSTRAQVPSPPLASGSFRPVFSRTIIAAGGHPPDTGPAGSSGTRRT